ncbi:MAG: hypothetical protein PUG48_04950 [Clostridia bacterium]|nr:hypothetical protein [Clostridia bacterium]
MKKKLMCTVLATLMIASCSTAFSGCQSNSDAQTGTISTVNSQSGESSTPKDESSELKSSVEESSKQESSEPESSIEESGKEESDKQESSKADSGLVTQSFKEKMDSYEKFLNEFDDFLDVYLKTNSLLGYDEYAKYLEQYTETIEKVDEINEDELSDADRAYYLEANDRISKKIREIDKLTLRQV